MIEYYFLFGLALIWTIFAVVQDLRTREVSNWLNFSLIAFALVYRLFYSIMNDNWNFFLIGLAGVFAFVILAYVFYYGKVFAGGDAKLLMGYGAVLPFESISQIAYMSGFFFFLFFAAGIAYTLVYSAGLVYVHWNRFSKVFFNEFNCKKKFLCTLILIGMIIEIARAIAFPHLPVGIGMGLFVLIPTLYVYAKSIEKAVMIKQVSADKLTEGDWLEKDVKVGDKKIAKSVHGLEVDEIKLLRKYKKKVWIKEGIPFTPTFLFSLIIFFVLWKKEMIFFGLF